MSHQHNFSRVFDILAYQAERYAQDRAVNSFIDGAWHGISITELITKVDIISCWLLSRGYKRGDMVALVPRQGNPDWVIIDFACQQIGVIIVPIHPTSSEAELNLILSETKPQMVIVADNNLFDFVNGKASEQQVFSLEKNEENGFAVTRQYKPSEQNITDLAEAKQTVTPDDILTIMYTSGTSGEPKGAILTHGNMVSNILFTLAAFPLQSSKKVMSYLPFSHIMERSACYAYIACGASIHFVRNKDSFLADFQSAKPYFSTSVPKVLEKMYDYLQEQTMAQNWLRRTITTWAVNTAQEYNNHKRIGLGLAIKLFFARILVLNKWKNQLGGKLECMVVGAASLRPEIARMFSAAKIRIREGYGMTEASPLISLNRFDPGMNRFGTVGIPIPAMDLKIDSPNENGEGEILIKGPNVTQGYYRRPELNKEVFTDDGWFRTGDVGKMVSRRFLQITDRKKDIFKTSSGKYVAPQPLENKLKSSSYITQTLVIGFSRPFVAALIVPNFNILKDWCETNDIHWTSPQFMVHNIKVYEKYAEEVGKINIDLPNYQRIKDFILCHEEWTIENNLLTNTLKPKRKTLLELNEKELNKLYA